jgi:hypothetical protein
MGISCCNAPLVIADGSEQRADMDHEDVLQMRMLTRAFMAGVCAVSAVQAAHAQLSEPQVLVVFDSRVSDSVAVAEYYAGSAKVPGPLAAANTPTLGKRPGVYVFDLASAGAGIATAGNITYADFVSRLRDPIRAHLQSRNLATRVRCIVTTKGLAHRIADTDNAPVGDLPSNNPGSFIPELLANDVTCASVESELTLLFQDLSNGEAGNSNDSRADGLIVNPLWNLSAGAGSFSSNFATSPKSFSASGTGPLWNLSGSTGTAQRLNPGDVYLTARLDGPTVSDVRAMLDRSQGFIYNGGTQAFVFDSDPNALDAISSVFPSLGGGSDYALSVAALNNDGRFPASSQRVNTLASATQFFVGPRLSFAAGQGVLVNEPLILLASYGANHDGVPSLLAGGSAGTVYATSFNLAPGAIFNTIESFNCRDFGGLGNLSFAAQQQASTYIAAGGTFAVGNVWEPLADTIPDNALLVRNFVLGNQSWGEAAWSSIPALSWMQTVIGDPLARAQRRSEDITGNNRVTLNDLHLWEALPTTDARKDVNRNGAADNADRLFVTQTLRASERVGLLLGR